MRKLVTIQRIKELIPIKKADRIETAKILGWYVVVKKGEFKVGDKVVYAEVDSVFPETEQFEFLKHSNYRIRTAKLRGQVSQGICFPLSVLPQGEYEVGDEVTDLLGVEKYVEPIPPILNGKVRRMFPEFLSRTDETRVQVLQEKLTKHKDERFVATEKLDGTSSTFYIKDGDFGACSKNLDLYRDENNTYWQMVDKYDIKSKLSKLGKNIAIQGEIIGDGIEKNKYKLPQNERKLFLYGVYDIDNHERVGHEEFVEIASELGIPTVPIVDDDFDFKDDIDYLVEISGGPSLLNKETMREGLVIKTYKEINDMGERVSFKALSTDFLIKHDE